MYEGFQSTTCSIIIDNPEVFAKLHIRRHYRDVYLEIFWIQNGVF